MDDLLFPKPDRKKPPKPVVTCWGCGIEQGQGERFKQCPKCVEDKLIPAKFCSDECFHSSWKQHKAWHKEQLRLMSQEDACVGIPHTVLEACAKRSEYDACLAQAITQMKATDVAGTKKILRKAIKLDPNRPEAYVQLAVCSEVSGQVKQTAFYYELAIQRWALVALTGLFGGVEIEEENHPTWALKHWSTTIDFVTYLYWRTRCTDHPHPEWYKIDGLLKIVAKTAVNSCNSDSPVKKKARLSLLQGNSITGAIRDGKWQKEVSLVDLSSAELLEAASCFRFVVAAARAGTDIAGAIRLDDQAIASYNSNIRSCSNLAAMKMTEEVRQMSANGESKPHTVPPVGSWVAFRSHKRNALPDDILEKGFGQVIGDPNSEGKVPIKVQGTTSDGRVLISPVNLVESPQNEQSNALVACLETETQWKFMAAIFEGLNEQGLLKSRRR